MKKRVVAWLLSVTLTVAMMPITVSFALSYSDYSTVPIGSYQSFRDTVIGKAYNVDGNHGAQCWDGACILWKRLGSNLQTGNGYAKGCWDLKKSENAGSNFDLIYNISDVKRGDVVVFSTGTTGHIGFADEDYSGSGNIAVLAQNQGSSRTKVTSYDSDGGCYESAFNVTSLSVSTFLGAFRYKGWYSHTHSFSSAWTYDSTSHWHNCTGCTEISGKAAHSFNSGIVTAEPTYYDVGIKTYTCTVCGYFYTTAIPRLNPSGYCGGEGDGTNLTWTLDWNTGVLTISGTGKMADYGGWVNPAPWRDLDFSAVSIGSGVTTIGDRAFEWCESLVSVTIPDSVTTIGDYAFEGCSSLTDVAIPNRVTRIGDGAFGYCSSLTSIAIPNSVTDIGGITTSGESAFIRCDSLTRFVVDAGNTIACCDSDGVLFNKEKAKLIQYPAGSTITNYVIPSQVKDIGNLAFGCSNNLISITIPDGVVSIGEYAFASCLNLTSVDIPDSVTDIDTWAFSDNISLTYNIYDNAKYLGNSGNPYLYLVEATDRTIASCDIHPDTRFIRGYAFLRCDILTTITIPNSVTTIGDCAFEGCNNLADVTIPDTVTRIGDWAFDQTPWLESLGDFATVNGILLRYQGEDTSVTVPETVTKIAGAFCYCENITDITIPASVTEFSSWYIFGKCLSLKNLTFLGDAPFVSETDNIFEEYLRDDLIIHAPKNNTTWTDSSLYDADAQTWSGCHIVFDVEPQSVASDLNGDSSTDAADLAILARHVAKIELITDIDKENLADVNGDTFVTAGDLTALARLIKTQEAA